MNMNHQMFEHFDLGDVIAYASEQHKHQTDKGGHPYILHPLRVAQWIHNTFGATLDQQTMHTALQAAIGHDLLEDTNATSVMLTENGFSHEAVQVIQRLTKTPGCNYLDYCRGLLYEPCGNPSRIGAITTLVKFADVTDNLDGSRIPGWEEDPASVKRMNKYISAQSILCASPFIEILRNGI